MGDDKKPTAKERLEELQEQYQRLQAEFANYKRRTETQAQAYREDGRKEVLKALVNVIDDFALALQNANEGKEFQHGMEMIYAKLISTGEDLGLERIKTVGEHFDPAKHEALLAEESDKRPQEILEELQAGYAFNGQTLRTAKVKVSK